LHNLSFCLRKRLWKDSIHAWFRPDPGRILPHLVRSISLNVLCYTNSSRTFEKRKMENS
jgi:hypothetical protein